MNFSHMSPSVSGCGAVTFVRVIVCVVVDLLEWTLSGLTIDPEAQKFELSFGENLKRALKSTLAAM